ncbi:MULTISPECIES: IS3 family transposase [unclassified Streptomyces]|uniref:IS3 family transposase n=1 Tax=Streptomyces sp. NBC_00180 TaxID=2903632 RepID=A0AAU1ID78_9ACTN|nr:IS3 family transposase [Streptomyces sp. NBC_01017]
MVAETHAEHRGNYGALSVHADLQGFGHTFNGKRVPRLMGKNDIVGRYLRKKKRTTIADRLAPPGRTSSSGTSPPALWTRNGAATSHTCRSARMALSRLRH